MDEAIIKKLIKLAQKAAKKDEVPVSAIITKDGKIISQAYNKRTKNKNPLNHAEIMAILKASKKLRDWRLNDCALYVTLKPCSMCEEVIKQARISDVYYLLTKLDFKKEYKQTNFIEANNSMHKEVYLKI